MFDKIFYNLKMDSEINVIYIFGSRDLKLVLKFKKHFSAIESYK